MAAFRECLGWLTTCTDERRCPMNWLEISTGELPTRVRCHVCEQEVELVATEAEFLAAQASTPLTAFPVVPPANLPASYGPVTLGGPTGKANGVPLMADDFPPPTTAPPAAATAARSAPPPELAPKSKAPAARSLFCVLTNGEAVKLDKDSMSIGRSRTCDIVIASAKVSRQHASISRVDGDFYIEDLGSANGVWTAGERIVGKVKIAPGAVFNISEETLTFEAR